MGIGLIVEILDHAPADLTAVDRLLLVAIFEKGNETTREAYPGCLVIARRMGWTDQKDGGRDAVKKALSRLLSHGIDVRVPTGTDKAGRPVYASSGHRTTYRLPPLTRGDTTSPLDGGTPHPPITEKGGTPRPGKGGHHVPKGGTPHPPLPSYPSGNPQSDARPRGTLGLIADAVGATDDEAKMIFEKIKPRATKSVDGLARHMVEHSLDEVRDMLTDIRGSSTANGRPAWCGECDERTRMVEVEDDRMAHCKTCHPRRSKTFIEGERVA